jgi:ABC-type Fe2+-enterobactin transport system substrate-binding protein
VEAKTIRDETGTTCRAVPSRMVKTTVTIKGRGTSSLMATAGPISGSVKVTSVKNTETNDDFPSFEITGVSYS